VIDWRGLIKLRILQLNESLHDVSIYYLLKALESRVISEGLEKNRKFPREFYKK
jgi:hypothetical protein